MVPGASRPHGAIALAGMLVIALLAGCSDRETEEPAKGSGAEKPSGQPTATASGTPAATASADGGMAASLAEGWERFPEDLGDGYYLGHPEAPLTITVYEDFQCPHCLHYTSTVEPGLIAEYVVDGKVRLQFQNFPILGAESVGAALAGECAQQQGRFWAMHHELFLLQAEAGQFSGERLNIGRFSGAVLGGIAQDIGLETATFLACFESTETLGLVQDQQSAARAVGLTGTPGVLFNGTPIGGNPGTLENWRLLIEAALDELETED